MWAKKNLDEHEYKTFIICARYGYKIEYVENMDADRFEKAYDMAIHLKYQDMLDGMQAASYPTMADKGGARGKFHKNIFKLSYPDFFRTQRAIKAEDLKLV